MSPELLLAIAFVIGLVVVQWRYVAAGQPTISERIRALFRLYPPFGALTMLAAGLFLGHWFWCP